MSVGILANTHFLSQFPPRVTVLPYFCPFTTIFPSSTTLISLATELTLQEVYV